MKALRRVLCRLGFHRPPRQLSAYAVGFWCSRCERIVFCGEAK